MKKKTVVVPVTASEASEMNLLGGKKDPMHALSKFVSIKGVFYVLITLMSLNVIVIGVIGFAFFLNSSLEFAETERRDGFALVYEKIESSLALPMSVADASMSKFYFTNNLVAGTIQTGLLNFSTSTDQEMFEYQFYGLHNNFHRMEMNSMDGENDRFFSVWEYADGSMLRLRRYTPIDNVTNFEISMCPLDPETKDCVPDTFQYVPWSGDGSITHQSKTIYEATFVDPYLFWCPGPQCDIFLAYTHPYHKDGEYVGAIGFAMESAAVRKYLIDRTPSGSRSFIIDVKSGFILSLSDPNGKIYTERVVDEETVVEQIEARKHPNENVAGISQMMYGNENDDYANVNKGKHHKEQYKTFHVDYKRYESDGLDWIVVQYTPKMKNLSYVVIFLCIFIPVTFVCVVTSIGFSFIVAKLIDRALQNLSSGMLCVENYDFDSLKFTNTPFKEIALLQRRFRILSTRLQEATAFLPRYLKKKYQIYASDCDSDNASVGSSNASSTSAGSFGSGTNLSSMNSTNSSKNSRNSDGQLNQSVIQKLITLVRIKWKHSLGPFQMVDGQVTLTNIIEKTLRTTSHRGGDIINILHDGFVVGFNVDDNNSRHSSAAARFCMDLKTELKNSEFDGVHIACVTGAGNIGILGSKKTRARVVFGEMRDLAEKIAAYAVFYQHDILINDACHRALRQSLSGNRREKRKSFYEFGVLPVDFVVARVEKSEFQLIYSLFRGEGPRNGEWMYTYSVDQKSNSQAKLVKAWKLFERNNLEGAQKIIVELGATKKEVAGIKKAVDELLEKKISFHDWISNKVKVVNEVENGVSFSALY